MFLGFGLGMAALFLSWLAANQLLRRGPARPGSPVLDDPAPPMASLPPLAPLLAAGTAERGSAHFRSCAPCHSIREGEAHAIGPNLWNVMGARIASQPGYRYSAALERLQGERWTWSNMNLFLDSPRPFAPGGKMAFAGIRDPARRADLLLYLNAQGAGLPLPAEAN